MQFVEELLPGTWLVRLKRIDDARGCFVKTYAQHEFAAAGVSLDFREEFYSVSSANVLRGMHFQLPPHDHDKFVYCPVGAVLDVMLDLRVGPGYGRSASVVLQPEQPCVIVIPKGIAHGFLALQDHSVMVYKTSTGHAPTHDAGILWDSFGFDWGVDAPVMSVRDGAHPALCDFHSPFGAI